MKHSRCSAHRKRSSSETVSDMSTAAQDESAEKVPYDPERHPVIVRRYAREGCTADVIAAKLKIGRATLYRWLQKYPELRDALKAGRDLADALVEDALYRRAIGYDYEETKVTATANGGVSKVEKVKKHVPASETAMIFWLKNRRPDLWRDQQQHQITGAGGGPVQVATQPMRRIIMDPASRSLAEALFRRLGEKSPDAGRNEPERLSEETAVDHVEALPTLIRP